MSLIIRDAKPADVATVLHFIKALAEYERMLSRVEADETRINETLFAASPRAFCDLAEWEGKPVGLALWFYNYSTFLGRHGIWLEDLFVAPEWRGKGIGKALLAALARRCSEEGLGRLEWSVLDWNEPSIQFYKSLGAVPLDDWTSYSLSGDALRRIQSLAP